MISIVEATPQHFDAIWEIFHHVVSQGDTYVFPPDIKKSDALNLWVSKQHTTFVAINDEQVVGTYIIKPNFPGLGSHIANCSYMVSERARGLGVGKAMGLHSIDYATTEGYLGMQFNIVVSSNKPAVKLWHSLGFTVIGTIPRGFNHASLGYVDTYIMYRDL